MYEQLDFDDLRPPNRNLAAPGLRVGRYLSIQERFEEWLATPEGDLVYREVGRRAYALRSRGWKHYGVKAIVESIRYDISVKVGPNDGGFKINDHYSSRIARKLMHDDRLLAGFFSTRELTA